MQSFVVSLSQNNQKRRVHIAAEFSEQLIPFEFFDAVTPKQNASLLKKYQLDTKYSELTPGAMACLLSHYTLWQKVIDENLPYIAIFEDDIYLGKDASFFLKNKKWLNFDFHIIRLEQGTQATITTSLLPRKQIKERFLFRLKSAHYCTAGYIISNAGAHYLINAYKHINYLITVDKFIFETLIEQSQYHVFQLLPALCIQDGILYPNNKTFPTTLPYSELPKEIEKPDKNQYSRLKKLKREIKRPFLQLKNKIFKLLFVQKVNFK